MNIIIKKSGFDKDRFHKRRKELEEQIKDGIMSKSEMNRGNEGEPDFDEKVERYDRWKNSKEPLIREWQKINREFKKQSIEGRHHTLDDLRKEGKMRYD